MASDHLALAVTALVERWRLPAGSTARLVGLVELLAGDQQAPTAVRDPPRAIDDHLADSLVALELDEVRGAVRIADLGSGAGFPGLPLAIALPRSHVSLLDSNARRCAFLSRAVEVADALNASVLNVRVERWTEGLGSQDLVTARALAPLPVVMEYAAPLLRIGGALVAWRGRRDSAAERLAAAAASELGFDIAQPRRVFPYRNAEHRYLHVIRKSSETPPRFPRRPGVALKRPLGRPPDGRADRSGPATATERPDAPREGPSDRSRR